MVKVLTFLVLSSHLMLASDINSTISKEDRVKRHVESAMAEEKKFAKEQKFYQGENYNFKGAEVNPDSLSSVPVLEVDDLDMDSVYD